MSNTNFGFCIDSQGFKILTSGSRTYFTSCFLKLLAVQVSNLILFTVGIWRIKKLMKKSPLPKNLTMNWKYYLKIGLLVILLGLKAVMAYFSTKLTSQKMVNSVTVAEIISVFAILVGTAVHHYESLYHYVGSPLMLLYWNFNIVVLGLWYWTQVEIFTFVGPRKIYFILSITEGVLILLIWLLELFKGKKIIEYVVNVRNNGKELCPEQTANVYSRFTFQWMFSLLSTGKKRVLRINDMWELPEYLRLEEANSRFEKEWEKEMVKYPNNPNLWRVILRCYGGVISVSMLYKFIRDVLGFSQTLIFSQLLAFVSSYAFVHSVHQPIAKGFILSVAMLLTSVVQSIFMHQYFHLSFYTGINVKNVLTTAVYKKSLNLSNSARQSMTTGEIFNRMTVDAQRISDIISYVNIVWSGPLQILIAVALLYNAIGPSAFTGVGIMMIGLPINVIIGRRMQKLQKAQMKNKDRRVRLIDEILSSIKSIKLYAWEPAFIKQTNEVRNEYELKTLKKYGLNYAGQNFIISLMSFLVSFGTFAIYSIFHGKSRGPLTAQMVFVSLSLFNMLQFPLSMLPLSIALAVEANVSAKRMVKLFVSEELQNDAVHIEEFDREATIASRDTEGRNTDSELLVQINGGTFTWGYIKPEGDKKNLVNKSKMTKTEKKEQKEEKKKKKQEKKDKKANKNETQEENLFDDTPVISDINFKSYYGELVGIVGLVGSGKSSMISAMLGDMKKLSGSVKMKGRIAYVPQQPWIINSTFRENIIFGQPYDETFYTKVIKACELERDVEMLKGGHNAEIGEKGINLSGGQKARVSLARAVYARAHIYLLDDPLSAVDAHVGRNLMRNVIGPTGLLKHKCRILVTHAVQYLPLLDNIYVVDNGRIVEQGTHKELTSNQDGVLFRILGENINEAEDVDTDDKYDEELLESKKINEIESEDTSLTDREISRRSSISTIGTAFELLINNSSEDQNMFSTDISEIQQIQKDGGSESQNSSSTGSEKIKKPLAKNDSREGKLIGVEESQTGRVKLSTFLTYVKASTVSGMLIYIFLLFASQLLAVMANIWLQIWSNQSITKPGLHSTTFYILIYGLFGLVRSIFISVQNFSIWVVVAIRAAKKTHSALFQNIMRLPMSFFDTTPLGRVLNRLSKDQETIDNSLPKSFDAWAQSMISVLAALVVISVNFWMFAIAVIPLIVIYYYLYDYYITSSRELKRLESTTRSPIYAQFQETLNGVSTIRSYNHTKRFINHNSTLIVTNTRAQFPYLSLNRWLSVRLEAVGGFIIFFSSLFAVVSVYIASRSTNGSFVSASRVGLAISYSLTITMNLSWGIRQTAELENNIVSVEQTLNGVSTIRSYNHTKRFINHNSTLIVTNTRAQFPYLSLNRWLSLRLEFIGGFIIFFASLFAVVSVYISSKSTTGSFISASRVGLAISYSLTITQSLSMGIRQTAELENNIVSVERNKEYSELPTEAPEHIPDNKPPSEWPDKGEISFKHYSTRYREGLDLVLKDIDLTIPPGSKVGVVGRTGAGKSSLTLALFRIVEAAEGSIIIDGIDISKIGLVDLRSNLIIIPQDPALFEETLRHNLDPYGQYSDAEIWNALELSRLKPWVLQQSGNEPSPTEKSGEVSAVGVVKNNKPKESGLNIRVNQGGTNLSLGQRQLVCLARALLRRAKVLVLDEATAAIDVETDRFIQEVIRSEFKDCTVITIAHRLNTIMDSDYILVLDKGKAVEFDTPGSLLADSNTVFSGLVQQANDND
ncbi:hypothetical protein BB559_002624 [Furculomyces boomerangus]|uniref:Uncharacterized protein n=1 Tax=Furculomyces boomerangus TaxID=61424 RepID=A0A2T9YTP7_9FUNG|nr:hypothetical protein BB559_002624 [Furculomyces boomerangus]